MPRSKQAPFGAGLEVERPAGGSLRGSVSLPQSVDGLADALTEKAVGRSLDRVDALPLRKQALVLLCGGLAGCGLLWALNLLAGDWLALLSDQQMWLAVLVLACSALAAYGALQLYFDKGQLEMPNESGGKFGSFVAASQDEGRWKRRLAAVAIGLVHTGVYFWA